MSEIVHKLFVDFQYIYSILSKILDIEKIIQIRKQILPKNFGYYLQKHKSAQYCNSII